MSEWNLSNGEWRDSNPFGHRMHDFIMENCEWSIYIRKDDRFHCPDHYDEQTSTYKSFGDVDCWCWGLGVAVTGMIVPCRTSRGRFAEIGPADGEVRNVPGYMDLNQDVLHFPRGVLPQVNDLVLQCEWNTPSQGVVKFPPRARPIRVHSIYIIRLVNAHFQREVSHFSCGVETINLHTDLINSFLSGKLANLPVYDAEKTWQQISYWQD